MPKHHQNFSPYQQGIVRRFFQHRDGVLRTRLAELVSEIFVADPGRKLDKLWKSAAETLAKAGCDVAEVDSICTPRDVQSLARIVSELQAVKPSASAPARGPKAAAGDDRFE